MSNWVINGNQRDLSVNRNHTIIERYRLTWDTNMTSECPSLEQNTLLCVRFGSVCVCVCVCDILCVWCDSSIGDTFTTHQNSKQTNQTNERTGNKGNNNNSKCRLLIRFNQMIFYIPMNWHTFALWNCHSVWMWRARVCFYVIYSMINFIRIKNEPQFNAMSVTNSNGTALHQRCIVSRCQKNNKQNSTLIHIELFVQSHSLRSIEHRFNDFHFFFRIFNLPTIRTLYTFYIAIETV